MNRINVKLTDHSDLMFRDQQVIDYLNEAFTKWSTNLLWRSYILKWNHSEYFIILNVIKSLKMSQAARLHPPNTSESKRRLRRAVWVILNDLNDFIEFTSVQVK